MEGVAVPHFADSFWLVSNYFKSNTNRTPHFVRMGGILFTIQTLEGCINAERDTFWKLKVHCIVDGFFPLADASISIFTPCSCLNCLLSLFLSLLSMFDTVKCKVKSVQSYLCWSAWLYKMTICYRLHQFMLSTHQKGISFHFVLAPYI